MAMANRWGHSCTLIPDREGGHFFFFGGRNGDQVFNDAFACRPSARGFEWEQFSAAFAPEPRVFHTAVLVSEQLMVFGGLNLEQQAFSKLFKINVTKKCPILLLSPDALVTIFSLLHPRDLLNVAQVSKRFNRISSSDRLWKEIYENVDRYFITSSAQWIRGQRNLPEDLDLKVSYKEKCFAQTLPSEGNLLTFKGSGELLDLKLMVVGDGAVGKTSILITYIENRFPVEYVPTVFDNFTTGINFHNQLLNVSLWDTAGPEEYSRLRRLSYPDTDLFLVCFSVASPSSFRNVRDRWLPEIEHNMPGTKKMLVGTKTDLRTDEYVLGKLEKGGEAPITTLEGKSLAMELGFDAYVECSALASQKSLQDVFQTAFTCIFVDFLEVTEHGKRLQTHEFLSSKKNNNDKCVLC
jgi:small GTP-binding protein